MPRTWSPERKGRGLGSYGSSSHFELTFLPPVVKGSAKDTVTLLGDEDTSYSSRYDRDIKSVRAELSNFLLTVPRKPREINIAFHRYLEGWRTGKYDKLDANTGNLTHARPPFRGWRKAVILAATVTGIVLAINTTFAIVAVTKFPPVDGVGTIYTGDCELIKRWNTALHLTINVLSTALLAASSFTMQCLSSPTRSEVNKAHAKHISLDIGIASFKNLRHLQRWKATIWIFLCLSTLPLHLLWNSTIFSTSGTNLYSWVLVDSSFLDGAEWTQPNSTSICDGRSKITTVIESIYDGYKAGGWEQLNASQCFDAYNTQYINTRRNLIMVMQPDSTTNMTTCGYGNRRWNGSSVIGVNTDWKPGWEDYLYGTRYETAKYQAGNHSASWTLGAYYFSAYNEYYTIDSCYSEIVRISRCQLQYVSYIIYIVIGCNLIKVVCMCLAARYLWNLSEPILATIGDSISSFLETPDQTTLGYCLLDLSALRKGAWKGVTHKYDSLYSRKSKVRLYLATTKTRWWWTIVLCTLYLIAGFILFGLSFSLSGYTSSETLKQKFGQVDSSMILGVDGASGMGLIIDVLIANSFQLALSTTYFLYNSLYTAQCAALEWASYIQGSHKSLRVTWPRGLQRSTYYLQLPYRYGIPLTTLLVAMHFLISESIFLARLRYYTSLGVVDDFNSFTDVGFSPAATLTTCCVGAGMILAQVIHALRPLDNRIPIHGNNSAVISAMCHPEDYRVPAMRKYAAGQQDVDSIALRPITWGVTREPRDAATLEEAEQSAGHCSFTADAAELPQQGKRYR